MNYSTHYKLGHSFPSHPGFVVPFRLIRDTQKQKINLLSTHKTNNQNYISG